MWSVCKAVNNIVENVLVNRRVDQLMEFETSLKRNRASFLSPISNPSKSVDDRRSVKKADVEAIAIPSLSQRIILTQDLIEESCCLSDLFDLNEITALELVLTAEGHLSSQTG
uniref:Uncharacterized protein n=1 Tax=Mesocestoides corti TaxID=53468 RepID=A0A5K3FQM7_MESCO